MKSFFFKNQLTNSSVGLHSRIRGMLERRLPIGQTLCWNGQMEGIYISVSSALIRNGSILCPCRTIFNLPLLSSFIFIILTFHCKFLFNLIDFFVATVIFFYYQLHLLLTSTYFITYLYLLFT